MPDNFDLYGNNLAFRFKVKLFLNFNNIKNVQQTFCNRSGFIAFNFM